MVLHRMVHYIREKDVKDIIVPSSLLQMGLTPLPKQHCFGKPPKVWLNLHQPKNVKLVYYFMNKWKKEKDMMDSWHMNKSSISYEIIKIWLGRFMKEDSCKIALAEF